MNLVTAKSTHNYKLQLPKEQNISAGRTYLLLPLLACDYEVDPARGIADIRLDCLSHPRNLPLGESLVRCVLVCRTFPSYTLYK